MPKWRVTPVDSSKLFPEILKLTGCVQPPHSSVTKAEAWTRSTSRMRMPQRPWFQSAPPPVLKANPLPREPLVEDEKHVPPPVDCKHLLVKDSCAQSPPTRK